MHIRLPVSYAFPVSDYLDTCLVGVTKVTCEAMQTLIHTMPQTCSSVCASQTAAHHCGLICEFMFIVYNGRIAF